MGLCFSSMRDEGKEKPPQVRFSAGLETLLRDAEAQRSPAGAEARQIGLPPGLETLLRDHANVQPSNSSPKTKSFERQPVDGFKPPTWKSFDRNLQSSTPGTTRKSFDRKLPTGGAIRKSFEGRPGSTPPARKSFDRRPPVTASGWKSVAGNTTEELNERYLGLRTSNEDTSAVDSNGRERLREWRSLEYLLKESSGTEFDDGHGQKPPMARSSPSTRPSTRLDHRPSPKVHASDGHPRMSPGGGRSVARKPVDRKLSAETKPSARKLAGDGNLTESRKVVDQHRKSVERKPGSERKVVPGSKNSVDRKSVDRTFVDKKFIDGKSGELKSVRRKSLDRKSMDRSNRAVEPSDFVAATNVMSGGRRTSLDRIGVSPDHYAKGLKKTMARNGFFTPDNGDVKSSRTESQRQHRNFDHRVKSSFTDMDFLTQKFLVDNFEQTVQSRRAGAALGAARADRQRDAAEDYSPRDVRSGSEIDEFSKSCKESAAKAAARDLESFKTMTSFESSSDSSGIMVSSYN